jgi:ribosomal protein S18 acetylase RimI-like enzyme
VTRRLAPPAVLREGIASDAEALAALLDDAIGAGPYADSAREQLRAALASPPDGTESRALVIEEDGVLRAFALHGLIAGAIGAGKLHLVAVHPARRRRGYAHALVRAAVERLGASGARFVLAEMPDDPVLAPTAALLTSEGIEEVARVPDLFRDGIDLVIRRRWLTRG